jgi:glyoxylase-like metal-dependent hydrolase (beta-lactamase superfamily II)
MSIRTTTARVATACSVACVFAICGLSAQQAPPRPAPDGAQLRVYPVQGAVSVIAGDGGNITVQNGKDGTLLVDTGLAQNAGRLVSEVQARFKGSVMWIINTHMHPDHVGGNEAFAKADAAKPVNFLGARLDGSQPLKIIAQSNVLARLVSETGEGARLSDVALPRDEYATPFKDMRFNDEAVVMHHEPKAHTDGDTLVYFQRSDVISTGDLFTPGGYPFIDVARGGSVNGEIAALNHILDLAVPGHTQEGGTYVIPGHGRLCDEADVVEYRDMVVIVRDRVQDMIKKGMTLEQVQAAAPSRDYDTEYVSSSSFVKANDFVAAIYRSLTGK